MHMVEREAELESPLVRLRLDVPWGDEPETAVYRFDQEVAKTPARYLAQYNGYAFYVRVSARHADAVRSILKRLNPVYRPTGKRTVRGWWGEIESPPLSKPYRDLPWLFAVYREDAGDRDDGLKYIAFLFRDREWTCFGIREWLAPDAFVRNDVMEKLAYRVVTDGEFRKQLVPDDPDLPLRWRRR